MKYYMATSRARTTHASSTSTKATRARDDEFHMVLYVDDILTFAPKDSSLYKDWKESQPQAGPGLPNILAFFFFSTFVTPFSTLVNIKSFLTTKPTKPDRLR